MDPHIVLGVAPNAGLDEVRQAYRKMALKWHPDRQTGDTESTNTFAKINFAYQTLIRDLHLPDGSVGPRIRPMRSPPPSAHSMNSNSSKSPENLFTPLPSAMSSQTTPSSSLGGNPVLLSAPSDQPSHPVVSPKGLVGNENTTPRRVGHSPNSPTNRLRPIHLPHTRPDAFQQSIGSVPILRGEKVPFSSFKQSRSIRSSPVYVPGVTYPLELLQPGPPLQPIGTGTSGEWSYSLHLTLEELFYGKRCRFAIVRRYLSGDSGTVMVEVDIPAGCQTGNVILSRGIGHELPDGTLDDVSFTLEEVPHERFIRVHDDLFIEIQIPWTEALRRQPKKVYVGGIDGEEIFVYVDYSRDKKLIGSLSVRGAGMPVRERGNVIGRGNLIVK